jgi:hypothetical protein
MQLDGQWNVRRRAIDDDATVTKHVGRSFNSAQRNEGPAGPSVVPTHGDHTPCRDWARLPKTLECLDIEPVRGGKNGKHRPAKPGRRAGSMSRSHSAV